MSGDAFIGPEATVKILPISCLTHFRCLIIFGNDLLLGGLASPRGCFP